nr:TetR/AcrR family transcriptional regulator [Vibrio sp.]
MLELSPLAFSDMSPLDPTSLSGAHSRIGPSSAAKLQYSQASLGLLSCILYHITSNREHDLSQKKRSMGKSEQNKEQKRRDILRASQSIFLSEGYVLASMDKIASKANVTKQTVYRYYPSKIELFRQSLYEMGKKFDKSLIQHLSKADTQQALNDFAMEFVTFHLSDKHLSIFRLLVAESAKAPEIVEIFQSAGEEDLLAVLKAFFLERFGVEDCDTLFRLWFGMLLSFRSELLIGMDKPSKEQIEQHVLAANDLLMLSLKQAI